MSGDFEARNILVEASNARGRVAKRKQVIETHVEIVLTSQLPVRDSTTWVDINNAVVKCAFSVFLKRPCNTVAASPHWPRRVRSMECNEKVHVPRADAGCFPNFETFAKVNISELELCRYCVRYFLFTGTLYLFFYFLVHCGVLGLQLSSIRESLCSSFVGRSCVIPCLVVFQSFPGFLVLVFRFCPEYYSRVLLGSVGSQLS